MTKLFEKRIKKLKAMLTQSSEALMITNEVNIGYFTGFFHSEGTFIVTQNSATLLVDFRYHEAAQNKSHGCDVVCFERLTESVLDLLTKENTSCVHVEADNMTLSRFTQLKDKLGQSNIELISDGKLDSRIGDIRIIKDETELAKIAKAQQIAEEAYLETLNFLKPGVTERQIAARLEYEMKLRGAEDISFDSITITGAKTSLPHGVPGDEIVREGDFFTCDFGAMYEGYHSDTTRTVAIGSATEKMREIYSVVLNAQLSALEIVKEGVAAKDVDKTARDIITQKGYGKYFGHSTGHGVGLDIHELPFVSTRGEAVLKEGMVITDEPGIYLPGEFGVRIEDMLCVTKDGYRNFVNLPKELIIL